MCIECSFQHSLTAAAYIPCAILDMVLLTLGAHAQRGLQYSVCLCVCVCVCVCACVCLLPR